MTRTHHGMKFFLVCGSALVLTALSCSNGEGALGQGVAAQAGAAGHESGGAGSGGSSGVMGGSGATGVQSGGSGASGGFAGAIAAGGASADVCATDDGQATYPAEPFVPDADTVAWYELDDLTDSGPQGLTLTNVGGVALDASGLDWSELQPNGVAHFTGDDAQSLSRSGISVGESFTLDAHVYFRGFRNRSCGALSNIVALSNGASGVSFGQRCGVAFGPRVRVNDATDIVAPPAFEDVTDNAWHWVRFAITGGQVTFSLDGKPMGDTAAVNGLGSSDWTLRLGSGFYGDIDEVRLVKRALPASAVPPRVTVQPAYRELTLPAASVRLTAATDVPNAKLFWSKLSGPGKVVFSDRGAHETTATFCAAGKYVLQALAYEGGASTSDELVVQVWPEGGRKLPYRVLFLGNSFSFYNGTVGYRYWELAKASGEAVGDAYAASPFVKHITSPGQPFQFHWHERNVNGECTDCADHVLPAPPAVNLTDFSGQYAQDVIANGNWDAVVMQSYSTAASRDPVVFARYGKKLDRLIKRSGARTVLYQTWSYPGADNTLAEEATLLTNYEALAEQTGAALSRVGRAFADAREQLNGYAKFPDGILFSDAKHPSSFGTYLAASVHFGVINGTSPADVAFYPGAGDISSPTIDSDRAKADQLRAIAAKYAATTPLESAP